MGKDMSLIARLIPLGARTVIKVVQICRSLEHSMIQVLMTRKKLKQIVDIQVIKNSSLQVMIDEALLRINFKVILIEMEGEDHQLIVLPVKLKKKNGMMKQL